MTPCNFKRENQEKEERIHSFTSKGKVEFVKNKNPIIQYNTLQGFVLIAVLSLL